MLDDSDTTRLQRFTDDARTALGRTLRSVVLYGEAASPSYRSASVALTTILVVENAGPALLRQLLPVAAKWRRRAVPVPLVFDDAHLRTSRDVFALELLAIHDQHLLVWGEHDPFAQPPVGREDLGNLRLEVEEHLKGKLLHLRQAYLESGGRRRVLRAVLLDAVVGFEMVLRGLLYLADRPRPDDGTELVHAAAGVCGIDLAALEKCRAGRAGAGLVLGDVVATFERVLGEIAALAEAADRFFEASRAS